MSLDSLKANIIRERELVDEILNLSEILNSKIQEGGLKNTAELNSQRRLIEEALNALSNQLKTINNAIPGVIDSVKFYKELESEKSKKSNSNDSTKNLINLDYKDSVKSNKNISVAISKKDQKEFLENLSLAERSLKKLKQLESAQDLKKKNELKPNFYSTISNKLFRNLSMKLSKKGTLNNLSKELQLIASPYVITTYTSMILFSTFISFLFSFVFLLFFSVFNLSAGSSLFVSSGSEFLTNLIKYIWVIFVIPLLTFFFIYTYPSSKRKELEKSIDQELPFVTIYMSAISTSGLPPTKIFQIISATEDYPFTNREIRKLLHYINFYGYNTVNALRYLSKNTPSQRFAEMLNGLATTITSGGDLTTFFSKHAEVLLFDYRMEREKYTRIAETFMDIYISIAIAAPMILLVLFLVISMTGMDFYNLEPSMIGVVMVLIVAVLNVLFLLLLNSKQPKF